MSFTIKNTIIFLHCNNIFEKMMKFSNNGVKFALCGLIFKLLKGSQAKRADRLTG